MKINENYLNLKDSYLFATVNRKAREYQAANPDKKVIKLGIGDVTIPIVQRCHRSYAQSSGRDGYQRKLPRLWPGTGL